MKMSTCVLEHLFVNVLYVSYCGTRVCVSAFLFKWKSICVGLIRRVRCFICSLINRPFAEQQYSVPHEQSKTTHYEPIMHFDHLDSVWLHCLKQGSIVSYHSLQQELSNSVKAKVKLQCADGSRRYAVLKPINHVVAHREHLEHLDLSRYPFAF